MRILYGEDHFFEWMTVVLLLLSAIFLVLSVYPLRNVKQLKTVEIDSIRLIILGISLFLILFAMEEISWGQRIFNWQTPEGIFKSNYQKETNLHNIFNPFFKILYPISGHLMFFLLIIGWIPNRNNRSIFFQYIFPHQSLFICAFLIMISSRKGHNDLFEQLISLFTFFYSLRIYRLTCETCKKRN